MGFLKNFHPFKDIKKAIQKSNFHPFKDLKKAANDIKKFVDKEVNDIKKFGGKVLGSVKDFAVYAALMPFKPVMIKQLHKAGIKNVNSKTKTSAVANLFFTGVMMQQKHLDFGYNADGVDTKQAVMDAAKSASKEKNIEDAAYSAAKVACLAAGIPPQAVDIVHMIIDFFRGMQKKQDMKNGKPTAPLTDAEKKFIDPNTPMSTDDKQVAQAADKANDALADSIPGKIDSKGNIKNHGKYRPILQILGFHGAN